ncbi:MAG: TlpA family protein disulfide reductase [Acidobacteria bacterium]|nr:TlpA family protein disulfide reductase [Acidobacteriota bacterium]
MKTFIHLLIAGMLLLGSCAAVKSANARKVAPQFELKDASGRPVKLDAFKEKVVLLNFWATNCGPCKIEIPWFMEFEQQFKDRGFAVLGVALDEEGWEVVKPYVDKHRVNYRVMTGTESVANLYGGIDAMPTTFLIDRTGRIAATHVGLIAKNEYRNEILELLRASI